MQLPPTSLNRVQTISWTKPTPASTTVPTTQPSPSPSCSCVKAGCVEREGERCLHKSSYQTAGIRLSLIEDFTCRVAQKPESAASPNPRRWSRTALPGKRRAFGGELYIIYTLMHILLLLLLLFFWGGRCHSANV